MGLFKEMNNEGVSIIQVTHSEKNAGYGSRIVNLLDGMIANLYEYIIKTVNSDKITRDEKNIFKYSRYPFLFT